MAAPGYITIPSPVVSGDDFHVVIKNSAGTIVFEDDESNAQFVVAGLTTDDYTMDVTYGENTVQYCFHFVDCVCPVFLSAIIVATFIGVGAVYHVDFKFNMAGGFSCPFTIKTFDGVNTLYTTISSLADFTSHVGDIYTKTIMIFTDHVTYSISLPTVVCKDTTSIHYGCDAPTFPAIPSYGAGIPAVFEVMGSWFIRLTFTDCGDTCHHITLNYSQNYYVIGHVPDAGTVSIDLDCGATYPLTMDIPVHPIPERFLGPGGTDVNYLIQISDCCGNLLNRGLGYPVHS